MNLTNPDPNTLDGLATLGALVLGGTAYVAALGRAHRKATQRAAARRARPTTAPTPAPAARVAADATRVVLVLDPTALAALDPLDGQAAAGALPPAAPADATGSTGGAR